MGAGAVLSQILGWVSTIAWSVSFYPQAILNFRRHSVSGLSLDYVYLNVEGFLAYSIYNIALFSVGEVRRQYQDRNNGHLPSVRGNDVAFAVHAFILSVVTLLQTFVYKRDLHQTPSAFTSFFIVVTSMVVAVCSVTATFKTLAWLDLLYYLSYLKLVISFYKLVPQAWINCKRKSTVGWSIQNIWLDMTGGLCSLAQLLLDASLNEDWGSLRGNPAKLILGLIAIGFDTVFMVQHYILYRHSNGITDDATAITGHEGSSDSNPPNERSRLLNQ